MRKTMKIPFIIHRKNITLNLFCRCCILLILLVSGCGDDYGSSYDESDPSNTGSYACSLKWPEDVPTLESTSAVSRGIDCDAAGVVTVAFTFYDGSSSYLTGDEWSCSLHEGTVYGIPAGTNRRLVVTGEDASGAVLYRGEETGITIVANQTTQGGEILMDRVPTISSTSPVNNATDVAVNTAITATFSEAMDSSTITTSTFLVNDGTSNIAGTVTYSGTTATFIPTTTLDYETTHTGTITIGVKDLAGNALQSDYTWSFTPGSEPDTTPPTVSSTAPANNATFVAVNTTISATFSEAMDASSITTATFLVNNGSSNIAGTLTYSGTTATFTPTTDLDYDTTYIGTITTGAKDLAGNPLEADYTWSFTTTTTWTMLNLPDTGQTASYTETYGEDSDYSINPPSYTDNGDGTVTDNVTGLMWQQEDDDTTRTWDDAISYCNDLTLGGYSDWRLPSKKELISIVDYGTYMPSIDTTYFPGTNASYYWSCTASASNSSDAWSVGFSSGGVYYGQSSNSYVRCVRGGQ